ncbi:hypothetical protein THMIRHAM_00130 [Thiomicrorhabdus immobilis]|uniref:Uncharacterized protein n=1 Tax=Thiomicrorhabdus immobilis TaxID=2791037 RepID=A0ABM7MA74_9GAMM|nr:hypothetical protein [Thiomicrorhabdus immobilis]BCN92228.1 hypothetical protein THMIRHAM_00130 [Thiomicrorhabdus immobilis]
MKSLVLSALMFTTLQSYAQTNKDPMLDEFHKFGITHCDEFIQKNTENMGNWKFFIDKYSGGIDGPSTEVSLTQISGKPGQSFKTDYTFIQTLKQCFLHKRGKITAFDSCAKAVDSKIWTLQFDLPNYGYKRYTDSKGIILYTKELELGGKNACLLEYEFRTKGAHSVVRK